MSVAAKPVSRHTTAARINHWITAVSLILLALSGLALFHPALYFLTYLFGGGELTRAIHPWIGVVLAISFLGLFFRFFTLNLWNRDDTVWMKNLGAVINDKEEALPELGKYNAGQKLVFWGHAILILALLGSAIVLGDGLSCSSRCSAAALCCGMSISSTTPRSTRSGWRRSSMRCARSAPS